MTSSDPRICPDCGSDHTVLVQRGLVGLTDESDQYFQCQDCGRVTYEIFSRTARELRASRIVAGRSIREAGHEYEVRRVLKVGLDEYLIYVRPLHDPAEGPTHDE